MLLLESKKLSIQSAVILRNMPSLSALLSFEVVVVLFQLLVKSSAPFSLPAQRYCRLSSSSSSSVPFIDNDYDARNEADNSHPFLRRQHQYRHAPFSSSPTSSSAASASSPPPTTKFVTTETSLNLPCRCRPSRVVVNNVSHKCASLELLYPQCHVVCRYHTKLTHRSGHL